MKLIFREAKGEGISYIESDDTESHLTDEQTY